MINRNYRYPHFELWEGKGYPPKTHELAPLIQAIGDENSRSAFLAARRAGEKLHTYDMTDSDNRSAIYSGAAVTQTLKDYFAAGKMHMVIWRQGELSFLIAVPEEHLGKKGYDDEMDTLLTNSSCDYSDSDYAEYAFEQRRAIYDRAVRTRAAVIHILSTKGSRLGGYVGIYSRTTCCFHLNYHRFYLDVAPILNAGRRLSDIRGFLYEYGDPDAHVQLLDGLPFLNVSGSWKRQPGARPWVPGEDEVGYNKEAEIYSMTGRKMAEANAVAARFTDYRDPALFRFFADMGVELRYHDMDGENWASFAPVGVKECGEKLPVVGFFGETGLFNEADVAGIGTMVYDWVQLAAEGKLILAVFAMESADDNDLLMPIMDAAAEMYNGDRSRFYVCGFSHNGNYTQEFGRRHGERLAAIGTFGVSPAQEKNISPAQLALEETRDLPICLSGGMNEVYGIFPMHSDPPLGKNELVKQFENVAERIEGWQKRLRSCRCPMRSAEEILATKDSADIVERKLGIPCDRSFCLQLDGFDHYIAEIRNNEGKYHLCVIGSENCCHQVTPAKVTLTWNFLRRFARDAESGRIIDLY